MDAEDTAENALDGDFLIIAQNVVQLRSSETFFTATHYLYLSDNTHAQLNRAFFYSWQYLLRKFTVSGVMA